jgi:hypothetical protein
MKQHIHRGAALILTAAALCLFGCSTARTRRSKSVDHLVGENWIRPGIPPPHADAYSTPNVALLNNLQLWQLIMEADPVEHRVLIALKPSHLRRGYFRGRSLIKESEFVAQKSNLLHTIRGISEVVDESRRVQLLGGTTLPIFCARIDSVETLTTVRKMLCVDYVEPFIVLFDPSSLACGADPYIPSADPRAQDTRMTNSVGDVEIIPYSYGHHKIEEAWQRFSGHPGQEQGIAVLDSGVSGGQEQFFTRYSLPDNPRRPHLRLNKTTEVIDDICFHGTKVASVAAAPRDGRSIVGIAWNAPLLTIKVTHMPWAKRGNVDAICQAIRDAVAPPDDRPPVRVVAMAFGLSFYSPTIAYFIEDAFRQSPSTLFIAAAGSNVPKVTFPASLDDFVTAVSLVELSPIGSGYRLMARPGTVSYGPEVDFVSVSTTGGIPASGVIGVANMDQIARFGLSSAATGIYAGIAALVGQYAASQNWTRDQILSALKLAASRTNITDHSGEPLEAIVGAGIVDVYRATGGAGRAIINAPYEARRGDTITFKAETDAVIPPDAVPPSHFTYAWSVNGSSVGSGSVYSMNVPDVPSIKVELNVRDSIDGKSLFASHNVTVVARSSPPMMRQLFGTSYVADWATLLNGGRHDRIVTPGFLPQGCRVLRVRGLLMCNKGGAIVPCPNETPQQSINKGNIGFTVSRPQGIEPNSLEVLVHQWHDGFSAVRTKVVYDIEVPAGVDPMVGGALADSP